MSSLFALLSQQNTNLQTRNGLIVLGLQNDFISRDGKLPVGDTRFLDRLTDLVSDFREHGDIIWVRSQFEANRPVDGVGASGDTVIAGDDRRERAKSSKQKSKSPPKSASTSPKPKSPAVDEELFLTPTDTREPCCMRGSRGAEYIDRIKPLIQQRDMQLTKTHYSAFGGTSLLVSLRSKLITDLFVCGCITNLSVYATAMDAARYGIRIILVEDCLGYRRKDRHDMAMHQLEDYMSAEIMSSKKVMEELRGAFADEAENSDNQDSGSSKSEDARAIPSPTQTDVKSNTIEVDSDLDDDEEVSLPIVRPFTRVELESSACSRSAAGQITTQREQSSSAQSVGGESERTVHREDEHEQRATVQSDIDAASSHRKLNTRDSPPRQNTEPWLDIIPEDKTRNLDTTFTTHISSHPGLAALCSTAGLSSATALECQAMMDKAMENRKSSSSASAGEPLFGRDKEMESQGSRMLHDLLPQDQADSIFHELNSEINWQTMHHQMGAVPRLVCCQAAVAEDGSMPVYRHPSDQTLPTTSWTAAVDRVRRAAELVVGHHLNHALIQLYRSGNDYISEHSDKTLDITPGSNIVNVSFGAQRTMRIRTKRGATKSEESPARTTYRVPMPHNSMLIMSLKTNAQYLHAINWDRRPGVEWSEAEKAYGGQRISLTFRNIGTYLDKNSELIWGQGATGKTQAEARPVINADPVISQKMIDAFGKENAASTIEYNEIYGQGFDVLHLK
ncbi:DNA oxidative demethylase ALKBH2 [Pseudocercospora fuligena]|uniref:DNA oxidative demethylase ALKBH2 n=1 Tax=Pseudocercospora fuligena TaxID=685502 RepID=A0A8H6VFA5_9PEZI|nr:DNA oxidative demethylase ALKBH2 [Pseudocercospora fuligena]